jgi:hypothetical protein
MKDYYKPGRKFLAIKIILVALWTQEIIIAFFCSLLLNLEFLDNLNYFFIGNDYSLSISVKNKIKMKRISY